jgi:ABC-2 type transport system permease protein
MVPSIDSSSIDPQTIAWKRKPSVLRFPRALFALSFKTSLALRAAFVMQTTFMAINNLVFFVFWWILLHRVEHIRGWRLPEMALLFGVVACSYGLAVTVAGGVRQLPRFIDEGHLDTWLTQPKPVLLYALLCRSQASGIGDFCSGILLIALSGIVRASTIPVVALAIVSSACILLASGVMFFSLAFWLGRVETAARQLFESLVTFALYPEPLFGGPMRLVLFTVLPAGMVGYLPVRLVRDPSFGAGFALVCATLGYGALAIWVFGRGLRRYRSGSRFGTLG